jgi:hypothetical protein
MELVLVIVVLWILVLPALTVAGLLCASALTRRRAVAAQERLATVVPLHPRPAASGRRVA